jgi:hypothetical protein
VGFEGHAGTHAMARAPQVCGAGAQLLQGFRVTGFDDEDDFHGPAFPSALLTSTHMQCSAKHPLKRVVVGVSSKVGMSD